MHSSRRALLAFCLAITLLTVAAASSAVTFTRHPWLSLQTTTSMLVAWQTDAPSTSVVLYGPEPVADWALASQASQPGTAIDHAVPLEGLAPGTRYRYQIVSDLDTLDAGSFRTAPGTPEPFRFLAFGDLGTATPAQRSIAARADSLNADLALILGDVIYDNGDPQNFTPYYFDIYRPTLKRIPFYPVLGNHDTYYNGGASFVSAFHLPENFASGPERSYSFDYANAHFAAIEVTVENMSPGAAAVAWLDADLAATSQPWKFVYFHVPMYSNEGSHGADAAIAAALDPIFMAHGVDLVFQAHNHFYTRTYPIAFGQAVDKAQDPTYLNPHGPIYVVAGGGGRSLHPLTVPAPYEVLSRSVYHLVSVDVSGDSLMLRAIREDGEVFDWMTVRKMDPAHAGNPSDETPSADGRLAIEPPRPNPSAGSADLRFRLPGATSVTVRILDASGRLVRSAELGTLGPGPHAWRWNGRDDRGRPAASGRYFFELRGGRNRARTLLTLVR